MFRGPSGCQFLGFNALDKIETTCLSERAQLCQAEICPGVVPERTLELPGQ
jgi:hypothetical protein